MLHSKLINFFSLVAVTLATPIKRDIPTCSETVSNGFTHPGIYHNCASLNRIQSNIQSQSEPFTTALRLVVDKTSYLQLNGNWTMQGPAATVDYAGTNNSHQHLLADGKAVYVMTLGWYATGNQTWLDRASTTIRAWANTLSIMNQHIQGAEGLSYMTAAAEILRGTAASAGWGANDTTAYADMITRCYTNTPWNETTGPTANSLFMNQGAYGNSAGMATAVFNELTSWYTDMIYHASVGANPDPSIDYAIPIQISGEADYYGQVTEMGRDQAHPMGTLRGVSYMGLTAKIQGSCNGAMAEIPNFFTQNSSRLLAGFEYYSRYNTNQTVPWEPKPIRPKTSTEVYATVNDTSRARNFTSAGPSPVEAIGVGWYALLREGYNAESDMGNYTDYLAMQGKGWDVFEFGDAATVQYLGLS